MTNTSITRSLIALSIAIAAMSPTVAFGVTGSFGKGISTQERALLAAAATAPTEFTIPVSQQAAVMGQAQVVIEQWSSLDSAFTAEPVLVGTNNVVRTEESPNYNCPVGFLVVAANSGNTADVTVTAYTYTAHTNSDLVCAHVLAYELQQFAATLPGDAHASGTPALPDDVAEDLQLIRTQVAAGDYSTALSTIDSLKTAVLNKQKQGTPQ